MPLNANTNITYGYTRKEPTLTLLLPVSLPALHTWRGHFGADKVSFSLTLHSGCSESIDLVIKAQVCGNFEVLESEGNFQKLSYNWMTRKCKRPSEEMRGKLIKTTLSQAQGKPLAIPLSEACGRKDTNSKEKWARWPQKTEPTGTPS